MAIFFSARPNHGGPCREARSARMGLAPLRTRRYEIQKKNLDKAIEIMEYWGLMVTLYDEVA